MYNLFINNKKEKSKDIFIYFVFFWLKIFKFVLEYLLLHGTVNKLTETERASKSSDNSYSVFWIGAEL